MLSTTSTASENEEQHRLYIEKLLEDEGEAVEVISMLTTPGCPAGENFVAQVLRVTISGRKKGAGSQDFEHSYILKRLPEMSSPQLEWYDCRGMFLNEMAAYETVLANYHKFMNNKPTKTLSFAKYHGVCADLIILEDLTRQGFRMGDKRQGMTLEECALLMKELSLFHAVSLAFKNQDQHLFSSITEKLRETVFCEEYITGPMGRIWESSLKFAVRSLSESGQVRLEKAGQSLKTLLSGKVFRSLMQLIKCSDRFKVVCHGDLWNNNIMFKYTSEGEPEAVRLLDLQAFRPSSCATDILHLLTTSTKPGFIRNYFQPLLSQYYQHLVFNMNLFQAPLTFSLTDLIQETKAKIYYGLLLSFIMFPCMTAAATGQSDKPLKSQRNINTDQYFREEELQQYDSLTADYHTRLHSLIADFQFLGLLD